MEVSYCCKVFLKGVQEASPVQFRKGKRQSERRLMLDVKENGKSKSRSKRKGQASEALGPQLLLLLILHLASCRTPAPALHPPPSSSVLPLRRHTLRRGEPTLPLLC